MLNSEDIRAKDGIMNHLSIILADIPINTMTNIDTLVEQLGKLTVVEAGELSKKLEEAWGLDLNALTSVQQPAQEVEVKEEKTTATVVLTAFADGKKIPVLQKVRKYKEMGLMEAKNFVEDLPQTVSEDILIEDAEAMKQQLEEAGGTVELK